MAKRKTPAFMIELIKRHIDMMNYVDELIDGQYSHLNSMKDKPKEYFIGLADGANAMLESALHSYGCYAGFQNVGKKAYSESGAAYNPWTKPGNGDYQGWRRQYLTR